MEIVTLLLYVGAVWVVGALLFFAWNLAGGAFEHADRLALLPLDETTPEFCKAGESPPDAVKEERGEGS